MLARNCDDSRLPSASLETGEAVPTEADVGDRPTSISEIAVVSLLFMLYVGTSAGLIAFNKYLVNADRFPFPKQLVCWHALVSSILAACLLAVKPSLFPSLRDPDTSKRVAVNWKLCLKGVLPIAMLFSVSLVLSNTAYLYGSMAFLQMIKESNVVWVYCIGVIAAVEHPTWQRLRVLLCIVVATVLTIRGEMHFTLAALVVQGSGQVFESVKIVLQSIMLSGHKLDPFTYVLIVMPGVFTILAIITLVTSRVAPDSDFGKLPTLEHLRAWGPMLVLNALAAFLLNVVCAFFIKRTSAVAYILAGICKDTVIVLVGVVVMGETVGRLQVLGFALQLCFIGLWSLMRSFPECFDMGELPGVQNCACKLLRLRAFGGKRPVMQGVAETPQREPAYGATVGGQAR